MTDLPAAGVVIGSTIVRRTDDRHTETVLLGGKVVHAVPHDDDAYVMHAADLGYGADVARMSYDHELTHTLLAHWLGLPESPVMRAVAEDAWHSDPTGALGDEEAAVLAIQRLCQSLNVDLGAVVARYGEMPRARGGSRLTGILCAFCNQRSNMLIQGSCASICPACVRVCVGVMDELAPPTASAGNS